MKLRFFTRRCRGRFGCWPLDCAFDVEPLAARSLASSAAPDDDADAADTEPSLGFDAGAPTVLAVPLAESAATAGDACATPELLAIMLAAGSAEATTGPAGAGVIAEPSE